MIFRSTIVIDAMPTVAFHKSLQEIAISTHDPVTYHPTTVSLTIKETIETLTSTEEESLWVGTIGGSRVIYFGEKHEIFQLRAMLGDALKDALNSVEA